MHVTKCDGCQKIIVREGAKTDLAVIVELKFYNPPTIVTRHACSDKCAIDVIRKYFIDKKAEEELQKDKEE